jgi:putative acetyltransferase
MSVSLRPIKPEDNRQIADLIKTIFREFKIDRPGTVYTDPTTDHLFELFQAPGSCYWLGEIESCSQADVHSDRQSTIIGGCGIYPTPDLPEGYAELVKLYVDASYRGQGIGLLLMEKCFESARQLGYSHLYLETLPELSKAVSMYERAGFRHIHERLGKSGHFSCHIWMVKEL